MLELKESIVVPGKERQLVSVDDNPQISTWGKYEKTVIEAPVYIGRSQVETGFIGAFSVINLHAVHHETTNCSIECESIGRFCMIAHSVHVGFPSHPVDFISSNFVFRYDDRSWFMHDHMHVGGGKDEEMMRMKYLDAIKKPWAVIGNDVWIGYNAIILNGVRVGNGSIIAAGSVVTKDVEPYSIVGGNPAVIIRKRFNDNTIDTLQKICWWEYGPDIMHGIDLSDVESGVFELGERVASGKYRKYNSEKVIINNKTGAIEIID